jgi:hypothetical protein
VSLVDVGLSGEVVGWVMNRERKKEKKRKKSVEKFKVPTR